MALDSNVLALTAHPPELPNPLDAQAKILGLQNLRQQQQLGQQQIQGAQLENQQKQIQMAQQAALADAYRNSSYVDPITGTPGLDTNKMIQHLSSGPGAALMPGVISSLTAAQKAKSDLIEQNAKIKSAEADYVGNNAHAIIQTGNNPTAAIATLQDAYQTYKDPKLLQAIQAIQATPNSQTVGQVMNQFLQASPGAQEVLTKQQTAQAATERAAADAKRADIDQQTLDLKKPVLQSEASTALAQSAVQKIVSTAKNLDDVKAMVSQLPPQLQTAIRIPDQWNAVGQAQMLKSVLAPKDQVAAQQKDTELQQGAQRNSIAAGELGVNRGRLAMEQQGMLSPAALQQQADKYLATGEAPQVGMGPMGAIQRAQIMNMAAAKDPNAKMALREAQFQGDKMSLESQQKQADQVNTWLDTAGKNMQQFLTLGKKIVDSGSPWINKPLREIDAKALGNADLPAFLAAKNIQNTEIGKITNGVSNSGSLTDSARHEIEKYNPDDITFKQAVKVIEVLTNDANNRSAAYANNLQTIANRIGTAAPGALPSSPTTSATSPSTATPASKVVSDIFKKHKIQ